MQCPSNDPWDFDYVHSDHTMWARWSGTLYCSLCICECTKRASYTGMSNYEITWRAISLLHAKMKTRIAWWIAHTLGSHSEQGKKHITVLKSIKEERVKVLALSETSCWTCRGGVTSIWSYTISHFGTYSTHVHGVAIAPSPLALTSWKAVGGVFQTLVEHVIWICVKAH